MHERSVQFEKKRLLGALSVLTFGLTALAAVLHLDFVVPVIFVLGYFILVPMVAMLGDSLPMVASESDGDAAIESVRSESSGDDAIDQLRTRYARGELTDAEFERRLERLIETEDADAKRSRERVFDRE